VAGNPRLAWVPASAGMTEGGTGAPPLAVGDDSVIGRVGLLYQADLVNADCYVRRKAVIRNSLFTTQDPTINGGPPRR